MRKKHGNAMKSIYTRTMAAPAFVLYTILFIIPTILGVYYGFTNWNAYSSEIHFTGLDNFKLIFMDQPYKYVQPIINTLVFAFFTSLFEVVLGLLLAIFLNNKIRGKNFLRSVYFIPQAIGTIVIGIMFTTILSPTGLLNSILDAIGLDFLQHKWLVTAGTAMPSVIAVEVWRYFGMNMVIFLAGLQAVDKTYYEKTYIQNQILGRALLESMLIMDKRCIVSVIRQRSMRFFQAQPSDLEGIVSQLRQTKGVEVAIFLHEIEPQKFKVSLRSKGMVDVSVIAKHFGGGGHVRAAGVMISGSSHDVINNITARIALQLDHSGKPEDK